MDPELVEGQDGEEGFDAGFAGEPAPTETPEPAASPAAPVEEPTEPEYAQITKTQLQELLSQAASVGEMKTAHQQSLDKAFGQLGGLKQAIDRLQTGGRTVEVTEEDVADLRAEFPEIADLTLKALQKVIGKVQAPGGGEQPDVERMVNERVGATRQELIDSRLDEIVDGDWKAEVAAPQFNEWVNTQADDVKALVLSPSLRDAARMLKLYRASKTAAAAPAPAPTAPAVTTRQRQLEAAVNPRSSRAVAATRTEEDEFDAGFKGR